MDLFIAFLKNMSLFTFVVVSLLIYAALPETISLDYAPPFFEKDYIFYGSVGFVIIFNLLMIAFVRLMRVVPASRMKMPHQDFWLENLQTRQAFYYVLQGWAYTFIAAINLFVSLLFWRIWHTNVMDKNFQSLALFWYLGVAIFIIWIVFIFMRLKIRKFSIWE
jgi:hypothetical protein